MVNYSESKIYKIIDLTNDNFYIGSTSLKYLSQRLQKHINYFKENRKTCKSYDIIKNGNFKIELIENYSCNDIYELRKREGEIIKENKTDNKCLNVRIETGLKKKENPNYIKEYLLLTKDKRKKYRETNKDKIKLYRQENKDKIRERYKEYKELNKDKIKDRKKEYYEVNKDRLNELKRLRTLYKKIDKFFTD
jgi:hypothetical protein